MLPTRHDGARMGRLYAPLDRLVPHRPRRFDRLFGEKPAIVAHRGGAGIAPENTYAAFDAAAELGVPFELDVHMTKSGELVVVHDDTLERTTAGVGPVVDLTTEAIDRLGVPRFSDVLERYASRVRIDVEIKTGPKRNRRATAVVRAIEAAGAVDDVFITSFDPRILEAVKIANGALCRGQLIARFEETDLAWYKRVALRNLLLNKRAEPDLIVAQHELIDREYFDRLKARGYGVLAWTVNDPAVMKRLASLGVDGIITDRPDIAIHRLRGHSSQTVR